MTKRIFGAIFLVAFLMMLACVCLIMSVLYNYFNTLQQDQMIIQTDLVAEAVSMEGMAYLEQINPQDYRITWIDADGQVLFDTEADIATMENHSDRPEVIQATITGYGQRADVSETLTVQMLYVAELMDDGSVMRLAVEQKSVISFVIMMLQPILIVLVISAIVSTILAQKIAHKLVEPINNLNLDDPLSNDTYEELSPLLRRLSGLHRKSNQQMVQLSQKQKEFDLVIGFMSEGLMILNPDGVIYSMNPAAARLLETDQSAVGKPLNTMNRAPEFNSLIQKARAGTHCDALVERFGNQYQLVANPIMSKGTVRGVVFLSYDITEKQQAEQMRREFSANVSHELKTPLHSISGCAEIIKSGLVQPQDVPQFVEQIYNEAQRLVVLVNDIIGLSQLDEGGKTIPKEMVNLRQIAENVAAELETYGADKQVALTVVAENLAIYGVPRILHEICYNLVDNAIKYNRPGGSVTVSIHDSPAGIHLAVRDTGIGIPPEHQGRIFERFYRVDKSHSKDIGGTGLGLSIVRHGAQLHDGTVSLESTPNVGTTISILFPPNH
ncbi:MAG: ATP-binding protein [Eubacteriales bacterium]